MDLRPATVTRTVLLPIARREAWTYLVDPARLSEWLGHGPLPLVAGTRAPLTELDGTARTIEALSCEPGRTVRWRWWADDRPEVVSEVEITVETVSDGAADATRLTIVERAAGGSRCSRLDADPLAWDRRLLGLELRFVRTAPITASV